MTTAHRLSFFFATPLVLPSKSIDTIFINLKSDSKIEFPFVS